MLLNNNSFRSVGALGLIMVVAGAAHAGSLAPQQGKSNLRTVEQGRRLLAARNARFVENKGQWNSEAKFLAKGSGVDVWYTDRGMRFDQHFRRGGKFAGQAVEMSFVGGKGSTPVGRSLLRASMDVFHGGKSVSGIRSFGEVYSKNVVAGVDLRGYYDAKSPRYDLIVAPGTETSSIRMAFKGMSGLSLRSGALDIGTKAGGFFNGKPLAYQMIDGARRPVNARWALRDSHTAGFEVGAYDKSKPLVIDPLVFGTYYGGDSGFDEVRSAIGDGDSVIIVGTTNSPDFPGLYGPYNNSFNPNGQDAFIARLVNNGADQDYSALIGGAGVDIAQYVKIDGDNNVWIAGTTTSNGTANSNYPATTVTNLAGTKNTSFFLTKFNRVTNPPLGTPPLTPINLTTGAFIQSLVLGLDGATVGQKFLTGFDLQPGSSGTAVNFALSGVTTVALNNLIVPNTGLVADRKTGHFFEGHRTGFIVRFTADTTTGLFYDNNAVASEYVEGTRVNETRGVVLDVSGFAYLVGTVYSGAPLNLDTSVPGNESFFETTPLVFQGVNTFYVTGRVQKATETFIRKYAPNGDFRPQNGGASATCFSGFLGGNGDDEAGGIATTPRLERIYTGSAIALGPGGDIYVTGTMVNSNDFPATVGTFQSDLTLNPNVYVARIDNAGRQILAATGLRVNSLGLPGDPTNPASANGIYAPWQPLTITPSGIAVDSRGLVFITGNCRANTITFPNTPGNPNQPSASTLSSIYFPTDAAQKAAFVTALSVEDQTYESPSGAEFPTTEGFLTGLDASLSNLVAQTYIGGMDDDFCFTPTIDPKTNQVFVLGWTDGNRAYSVANDTQTTFTDYIDPNGRQTNLPNGSVAPLTDNLLTLPRVKVNSGLNATEFIGDYGYGIFGTAGFAFPPRLSKNLTVTGIGSYNGLFFGRDGFIIKLSAVGTTAPSRLGSLTFSPNPVPSGATATGTITLSSAAPAGGQTVIVSTSNPNVTLTQNPLTIVVPAGSTSATFPVVAGNVATATTASFLAKTSQVGDNITGTLTISPLTYTFSVSPTSIVGTGTAPVIGTITLANPTTSPITFNLTSSDPAVVSLPASVTIPANGTTVSFTFNPAALPTGAGGESVTLTAKIATAPLNTLPAVTATLLVQSAQAVPVTSLTASVSKIRGGSGQVVFTVTFAQALPANTALTFSFGSNTTVFGGPKTFTVPAGALTYKATYNVNRVSRSIDVTITATANGSSASTKVTVTR